METGDMQAPRATGSAYGVFAFLFEPPGTVGRLLPLLAIVSLLFGSLLWMPPIRINNNLPPYSVLPELHPLPGGIMELAKMEHQKAIDEINLRIEHVDAWFNNKFFLVGALFAGFLLFLEPSWTVEDRLSKPRHSIK